MKKILKTLVLVFLSLFAFAGIALAEEAGTGLQQDKCTVKIIFKEVDSDGNKFDSGNGVSKSNSNTLSLNGSWSKFSSAIKSTEITKGGDTYNLDGWYDSEGNKVPESMYYNGDSTRIKVVYECKKVENVELVYSLKWNKVKLPVITFNYTNYINNKNGTGSWENTNGAFVSYTHTFKAPVGTSKYNFLYWAIGEDKYYDKDEYTIYSKDYTEDTTIDAYAWWQPAVTLNLYSDGKLLSSESSFESVSVGNDPIKYGYKFLGWFDEEGNEVTETTFNAAEAGIDPEVREYTLYAKWERIMVDVTVSKVWIDKDDEDEVRPESVTVELKDGEETVETVELSEENEWTYTFNVPKYNEKSEIEYTVSEEEIEFYTAEITGSIEEGFVITNTHEVWPKGDTDYEDEIVQTGTNVNTLYVSFLGLSSISFLILRKRFN